MSDTPSNVVRLFADEHNADLVARGDRPPPNEEVITRLEELLVSAKAGDLRNFIGVGMCLENNIRQNVYVGDIGFQYLRLFGALQLQLAHLTQEIMRCENEAG